MPSLLVGHSTYSQACTQVHQRGGQATKLLLDDGGDAVDFGCRPLGYLDSCCHACDQLVVDAEAVKNREDEIRVELRA